MIKSARSGKILTILCAGLLVIITVVGAYYLGMQRQVQAVEAMKDHQLVREQAYAGGLQTVQTERDHAATDYQTACYEYQKLYAAYNDLYKVAGSSAGEAKYSAPDGARGNETSCYR